MDTQVMAVRRDGDRSVPIRSHHPDLAGMVSAENIGMGQTKDVVLPATDNGDAGANLLKEGFRTGRQTAMMRNEQHVTAEPDALTDETFFRRFGDIRRQENADLTICEHRDHREIVDLIETFPAIRSADRVNRIQNPDMDPAEL